MIELRRILLVDWSLFRVEQIDIAGMTGLIGANGAGKSAVIDAMQTVLTGANMSTIRFNASAQTASKSKRSIRDYCLGVVSLDDKGERSEPTRTHAYTYVVLGFVNRETGKEINLGVAFSASETRADEDCEALFMVRGGLMHRDDLLEPVSEDEVETRQWHAVRTLLRARGMEVDDGYGSASEFVEEALRALSPPGYPLDPRRFMRAFRNALMLKPVDNPTEFVRNYVLDVQPIKIERLRQSIDLYRSLTDRIANLKAQSASLAHVLGIVRRTNENERIIRLTQWEIARLRWEQFRREVRDLEARLETLQADANRKEQTAALTASALSRLEADVTRVELALNMSEPVQLAARYEAERGAEVSKRVTAAAPLTPFQDLAVKIGSLVERRIVIGRDDYLHAQLVSAAKAGLPAELSRWAHRLPEDWQDEAARIDGALAAINMGRLSAVQKAAGESFIAAEIEVRQVQDRIDGIEANLKRLKEGRSVIEAGTRALIVALWEEGIPAEPLCDLVEVTNEKWRQAAEAALGRSREALIVDPKHANRASTIYRAGRDDSFPQAELVNTTKTDATRAADANALATVIATQNLHARAFVDFRLGRLQMVEAVEKLLAAESAITPDRMMNSARSVKKLPRPQFLKLGRASADESRRLLETERSEFEARLAEKVRTTLRLREDRDLVDDVARALTAVRASGTTYAAVGTALAACEKRIAELEESVKEAKRKRDPKLLEELERLKSEAGRARSAKAVADKEAETARRELDLARGGYMKLRDSDLPARRSERRAAARQLPRLENRTAEISQLQALARNEHTDLLQGHIDKRQEDLRRCENDKRPRFQRELIASLSRHCQEFHVVLPSFSQEEATAQLVGPWAAAEKQRLDTHELVQYEQQCRSAQEEMTTAFRDDLLHQLHDAFEGIKETLADLNRHLKDRQFHGRDYYSFKSAPTATHADLIELVMESRRPDFQLPLFSTGANKAPDTAVGRAIQTIESILSDQRTKTEELEDARQYFTFELYIHDEQGKIRSTLSSRTGTGSGGEGQLPFYIAIGASLAATYLDRRSGKMGLGLAVFDEAFNRLDTAAICACSEFLQDLGLQIVLAAPDEKRHVFMEVLDTVVNVNRVGNDAYIMTEYPTEKARKALAQADPYRKGFAAFKAELVANEPADGAVLAPQEAAE